MINDIMFLFLSRKTERFFYAFIWKRPSIVIEIGSKIDVVDRVKYFFR